MPKAKKKITLRDQKPLTDPKGGRRRFRIQGGGSNTEPGRKAIQGGHPEQ